MNGLVFGIDVKIGSCGWAVLGPPVGAGADRQIIDMGVWAFDVPETDRDKVPTNALRRDYRSLRRRTKRRTQRMARIRQLLHSHGLIDTHAVRAPQSAGRSPWEIRAKGLDELLVRHDFAAALGHIARHRGLRVDGTRNLGEEPGRCPQIPSALTEVGDFIAVYRTVGERFWLDPAFRSRRRGPARGMNCILSREDQVHETRELFSAQRCLGNRFASEELEGCFTSIAFGETPSRARSGGSDPCPFERGELRTSRFAPSFEALRMLCRLTALRVKTLQGDRSLTPAEIARALANPGCRDRLTYRALRALLALEPGQGFRSVAAEEEHRDIAARTGAGWHGTYRLRSVLGDGLWNELQSRPGVVDSIAEALTFGKDTEDVAARLRRIDLGEHAAQAILGAIDRFATFKGAGHVSALAARKLLPYLQCGLRYEDACAAAGYGEVAAPLESRAQIKKAKDFVTLAAGIASEVRNPVGRKSMQEALKTLWAMRNRWGLPDSVHITVARDVCASIEKRREIDRAMARTATERTRQHKEASRLLGLDAIDGETLLRYRLWSEQGGRCLLSGDSIPVSALHSADQLYQVAHILPWSRSVDDRFANKVLCSAEIARAKGALTPFEWLMAGRGETAWVEFSERIASADMVGRKKKRKLLTRKLRCLPLDPGNSALKDTGFASRTLAEAVARFFPAESRHCPNGYSRVLTHALELPATLRRAWGIDSGSGTERADERQAALDALVVAALDAQLVCKLTQEARECEERGMARFLLHAPPPWGDAGSFAAVVQAAYARTFVARPERRRARGEGHGATIRQLRMHGAHPVLYERRSIAEIAEQRLSDIKDADRNHRLVEAVREWMVQGRPPDRPPRSPAGDEIRKIRLRSRSKPAVRVRGGSADRGDMVRVDIYSRVNKRGRKQFYFVPVYPHQVMDRRKWPAPPVHAIVQRRDEAQWIAMDAQFRFEMSVYTYTYLELEKPDGTILSGYFRGVDRSSATLNLTFHANRHLYEDGAGNPMRSIGGKKLRSITKHAVDRLGQRSLVRSHALDWHGQVLARTDEPE